MGFILPYVSRLHKTLFILLGIDRALYSAHKKLADCDHIVIPYKILNRRFIALYGIITASLSTYFSRARYNESMKTLLGMIIRIVNLPYY